MWPPVAGQNKLISFRYPLEVVHLLDACLQLDGCFFTGSGVLSAFTKKIIRQFTL